MTITQTQLDERWDFSDPAGSEQRLRMAAEQSTDAADRAQWLTQVARALGLQERFGEADAVLDALEPTTPAVRARVLLERGRLRNSAGDATAAVPVFREAAEVAASAGLLFLQVDALHMLAIADAGRAPRWTAQALAALATTEDPRTLRWLVSVHNNAGWTHFDAEHYADALTAFEAAQDAATRWGTPQQRTWAAEAIAETRAALDS